MSEACDCHRACKDQGHFLCVDGKYWIKIHQHKAKYETDADDVLRLAVDRVEPVRVVTTAHADNGGKCWLVGYSNIELSEIQINDTVRSLLHERVVTKPHKRGNLRQYWLLW